MGSGLKSVAALGIAACALFASRLAMAEQGYLVGALGDSITRAMNARRLFDQPRMSWSTGDDGGRMVESHYWRLRDSLGAVENYNASKSGAVARDLRDQIESLLPHAPDYVTLLVGANDVCDWPADHGARLAEFQAEIERAVTRLVEAAPEIRIVLSPVPDMYRMYEVGKTKDCTKKWNTFSICPPLLGSERTKAERQAFVQRLEDANRALRTVSSAFRDHVLYLEELEKYPFQAEHVSDIDCFHPSIDGQQLLADITWRPEWAVTGDRALAAFDLAAKLIP